MRYPWAESDLLKTTLELKLAVIRPYGNSSCLPNTSSRKGIKIGAQY